MGRGAAHVGERRELSIAGARAADAGDLLAGAGADVARRDGAAGDAGGARARESEYEWRIGREFAAALPELERQCLDQAGRRLRQAYADGEREARFLAVLALFEADAGAPEEARRRIDEAAATGVVRPRLYYQQARGRYLEEKAKLASADAKFSLEQTRWMLAPLEIARQQRPALNEVYQALVELWQRCVARPEAEDLAKLKEGPRLFPRDFALAYNVGLLLARSGDKTAAVEILAEALRREPEAPEVRKALLELQGALGGGKAE